MESNVKSGVESAVESGVEGGVESGLERRWERRVILESPLRSCRTPFKKVLECFRGSLRLEDRTGRFKRSSES